MSAQDRYTCEICGEPCGYDDDKVFLNAAYKALCSTCKSNLASRICAFFGLENGYSWSRLGMEIPWDDVLRISRNIKRDYAMRVSYITTDKELYERRVTLKTPVEES